MNVLPVDGSETVIATAGAPAVTVITCAGANPGHFGPAYFTDVADGVDGAVSGLPHEHLTRGTPVASISTEVPAWRTTSRLVTSPPRKP